MLKLSVELPRNKFVISVNMNIPENRIYCLYGPSAAGKSSILSVIAGFERGYQAVRLELDGDLLALQSAATKSPVFVPAWRRRIAYLTQATPLFPHLTVEENITYGIKAGRIKSGASQAQSPSGSSLLLVKELVQRMDLHPYLGNRPRQLSGGLIQRVALARALATSPRVLLLDEPFSALDWATRREMQDLLLEFQQRLGMSVVLVTHQLEEAQRMANEIGILDEGRLLQEGDAQTLMDAPISWRVARLLGYRQCIGTANHCFALHPERVALSAMADAPAATDVPQATAAPDVPHITAATDITQATEMGQVRETQGITLRGEVLSTCLHGGRWSAKIHFGLPPGWVRLRDDTALYSGTEGEPPAAKDFVMEVDLPPAHSIAAGRKVEGHFLQIPEVRV